MSAATSANINTAAKSNIISAPATKEANPSG